MNTPENGKRLGRFRFQLEERVRQFQSLESHVSDRSDDDACKEDGAREDEFLALENLPPSDLKSTAMSEDTADDITNSSKNINHISKPVVPRANRDGSADEEVVFSLGSAALFSSVDTEIESLADSLGEGVSDFSNLSEGTVVGERYRLGPVYDREVVSWSFDARDMRDDIPVSITVLSAKVAGFAAGVDGHGVRLSHSNLVTTLDRGELENGSTYLVHPSRDGVSFRDLLRYRTSIVSALVLAFRQACRGVAFAHSQGIVHRNLKPSNIRIQNGGQVVVTGWWFSSPSGEDVAWGDRVLGTPSYMAPELLEDATVTPRADVYSLGVILFELFTGVTPSRRLGDDVVTRDPKELWSATITPEMTAGARSSFDELGELDRVIQTCLDPDPDKRLSDAGELLDAIEELL